MYLLEQFVVGVNFNDEALMKCRKNSAKFKSYEINDNLIIFVKQRDNCVKLQCG